MQKVFIDGSAGTTGLRIRERLAGRNDLEIVVLPDELRKDISVRRDALNSSDIAFLCLPDAAAIEAVSLVENPATIVIDTSTAHRTNDAWQYGFPELAGRRERIATAKRIANPGCHASGFIALVEPLVRCGIISPTAPLCAFSLTGYSGGGKKMIAEYDENLDFAEIPGQTANCKLQTANYTTQTANSKPQTANCKLQTANCTTQTANCKLQTANCTTQTANCKLQTANFTTQTANCKPQTANYKGGRQYALGQQHKHLPEMVKICGLAAAPVFSPIIVPHLSGMETTVMLQGDAVKGGIDAIRDCYASCYSENGVVKYVAAETMPPVISSAMLSGRDDMLVTIHGNDERIIATAVFDNLGKGASGAAIQNMNIALGLREDEGLVTA